MGGTGGARPALTKRAVDAATYRGEGRTQCVIWDGSLPGFGLRVHPKGRKSFVVFFRTTEGRKRLLTVGGYPELTVQEARQQARRLLVRVAEGDDPSHARSEAREAETFRALAEAYLEAHESEKRSISDDRQRIRAYLVPAWGARKARSITRADVSKVHRKVGQRAKYAANRTLALASAIFGWAEKTGRLPEGYPNPARGVTRFREESRERWLSPQEVRRLIQEVEKEPSIYVRAFFWLSLLTGCRKNELLSAKWEDVDLERAVLRLPKTKSGRVHHLPLSGAALAVLHALPREEGNPHVLPGHRRGASLVNVALPWKRIREAAGVSDARPHDLRRTVGSWMAQSGASLHLIGAVLNHADIGTTQVYARLAEDNRRDALEQHGEAVLAAAGVELPPARTGTTS